MSWAKMYIHLRIVFSPSLTASMLTTNTGGHYIIVCVYVCKHNTCQQSQLGHVVPVKPNVP